MLRLLITGANRGIGLELARQLLVRGDRVFAGYRDPGATEDLRALSEVHPGCLTLIQLDVTDQALIDASVSAVMQHIDGVDLLVNNAGAGYESRDFPDQDTNHVLGKLAAGDMLRMFHVNSVGSIMVCQAYLDLIMKGTNPKIVQISSNMGSIARRRSGGFYTYCASKTALNMINKILFIDLARRGITCVAMHPG